MEIEEYVRDKPKARGSRAAASPTKPSAGKKRKRNADPGRNIPEGASREFVPVSELIQRAAKKRQKDQLTLDDCESLKSDDDDRDLEENLGGLKRTVSDAGPITVASKTKKPLKRSKTAADGEQRKRATKPAAGKGKKNPAKSPTKGKRPKKVTGSQVDQVMEDDEDDEALQEGLPVQPSSPANRKERADFVSSRTLLSSGVSGSLSRVSESSSPTGPRLSGDQSPTRLSWSPSPPPRAITPNPISLSPRSRTMSPDPIPLFLQSSSQPQVMDPPSRRSHSVSRSWDAEPSILQSIPSPTPGQGDRPLSPTSQHGGDGDMSWLIEEDERDNGFIANDSVIEISSSPVRLERSLSPGAADHDSNIRVAESPRMTGKVEYTKSEAAMTFSSPQPIPTKHAMLPPPVPFRVSATNVAPDSTFPVRPMLAKRQTKRKAPMVEDDVSVLSSSPRAASPPRRLRQRRSQSGSPPKSPPKRKPRSGVRKGKNKQRRDGTGMLMPLEWAENEAAHSGDETSDGAISGAEDQSENEYDREFVNDFPSTQVSPSYNQTQIYRESLLTQVPRGQGPMFARGPMRRKPFGNIDRRLQQHSVSSSPPRDPGEGPDEYEMDSFVVPDDAEIAYSLSSDI